MEPINFGWQSSCMNDLLPLIYKYLGEKELAVASSTCKLWYDVAQRTDCRINALHNTYSDLTKDEKIRGKQNPKQVSMDRRNLLNFNPQQMWQSELTGSPATVTSYSGTKVMNCNLFTKADNYSIIQWNLNTGHFVKEFKGHEGAVNEITIKGNHLFTASMDGTAKRWDIKSGECKVTFKGHSSCIMKIKIRYLHLFTGSFDGTAKQWDIRNGECLRTFNGAGRVWVLRVYDDNLFTCAQNQWPTMWRIKDGEPLTPYKGHADSVISIKVLANRVFTSSLDYTVRMWERDSGKCIKVFADFKKDIWGIKPFKDKLLTVEDSNSVKLWDITTGLCLRVFPGTFCTVKVFGDRLFTGSSDKSLKIWDFNTGAALKHINMESPILRLEFVQGLFCTMTSKKMNVISFRK